MENFTEEKRKKYIFDTKNSLESLLNDALIGADQNDIKSDFPDNCKLADIKLAQTRVSFSYYNEDTDPQIEVVLEISYLDEALAEYSSIYDIKGELVDELFCFE
jgi:hypothetical protein